MKFDLCNDLWEKFTDTKKIDVYLKYRKKKLNASVTSIASDSIVVEYLP